MNVNRGAFGDKHPDFFCENTYYVLSYVFITELKVSLTHCKVGHLH